MDFDVTLLQASSITQTNNTVNSTIVSVNYRWARAANLSLIDGSRIAQGENYLTSFIFVGVAFDWRMC